MKVCLLSDTHYGIRGDSLAFLDANKLFFDNVFFPELEKQGVTQIIHLGDLVDKRKTLNINTATRLHADFLSQLSEKGLTMDVIVGNHDTYHKTTNAINALDELLPRYNRNVEWFTDAFEHHIGNYKVLYVPWICDENRARTLAAIKGSSAIYVFGHLELVGYQMYRGVINEHGDPKELFGHFDRVFSGHFHHKSSDGNVTYLGSHGQFTWSDYNDQRGFHILDFDSGELEFITNPYEMFLKIGYDDTIDSPVWNMATERPLSPREVENKYVKVVVRNRTKNSAFDKFISVIQALKPLDIQIIDEAFNTDTEQPAIVLEGQDTLTIFKNHIDTLDDMDVPKADLERLFVNLYQRASEVSTL